MGTMATTQRDDVALEQTVRPAKKALWKNLGLQVAVSMVLGIIVGLVWPEFGASLKILGDIFLRLIKTAVAPAGLSHRRCRYRRGRRRQTGRQGRADRHRLLRDRLDDCPGTWPAVRKHRRGRQEYRPYHRAGSSHQGRRSRDEGCGDVAHDIRPVPAQRLPGQFHRRVRARRNCFRFWSSP